MSNNDKQISNNYNVKGVEGLTKDFKVDDFTQLIEGLDASIASTKTFKWDKVVSESTTGTKLYELTDITITLVRVEKLQAPYFSIYSNFKFNVKSLGWGQRYKPGLIKPAIDINFLDSSEGLVDNWRTNNGFVYCDSNGNRSRRSDYFNDDFYSDIKFASFSFVGGRKFYRCS